MDTQERPIFTDDLILDHTAYKEYRRAVNCYNPYLLVLLGCVCLNSLVTILVRPEDFATMLGTLMLACLLGATLGRIRKGKKKDWYQQERNAIGGKDPHHIVEFYQDRIVSTNRYMGQTWECAYEHVLSIQETKPFLLLRLDNKQITVVEKRWLRGRSSEELIRFLRERCPNLKKRIQKGILYHILSILAVSLVALGLILSFASPNRGFRSPGNINLQLGKSYEELSDDLGELGISISPRTITELESFQEEYDSYGGGFLTNSQKLMNLLCWEGAGVYDEETWEWTPSESGVYWFDFEVFAIETMYTDFLAGISAASRGQLQFFNVTEDHSDVDWERGTGTVHVSFDFQGEHYSLDAKMDYDWFDGEFLDEINRILIIHGSDQWLYCASDDGQGCLVFYGDAQWAKEFMKATGISLYDNYLNLLRYGYP